MIAVIAVAGLGVASGVVDGGSWTLTASRQPPEPGPSRGPLFTMAGSTSGLFPGSSGTIGLVVTNPQRYDVVVTGIRTTVASPSPACPASHVSVAAVADLSLVVPAGSSRSQPLPIAMTETAPDACQGITFDLTYVGDGQPARGR